MLPAAIAAFMLLLAACATGAPPATTPETAAPPETPQELLARVKAGASQVRGLDFIAPVEVEYLAPTELTDYLEGVMGEEGRHELRQLDELLSILGLLEPDVDLVALYVALLSEGVLGSYDSEEERLVVRLEGDNFGPSEELTLAHELTHALQQQHFDIDSLLEDAEGNLDRGLAVTALAEGDATLSELLYSQEYSVPLPRNSPDTPVYDSAPKVIQELLLFPYAAGLQLLKQDFDEGGWSGIDTAYQAPPQSTEQVLHPEKYEEGEPPLEVALPDVEGTLGPEWAPIYSSTGGEFLLRHYLGSNPRQGDVDEAASGWGGDTFALYGDASDTRLLLWSFRWDSTEDAEEFYEGYIKLTENEDGWGHSAQGNDYVEWGRAGRWVNLQKSAEHVSIIVAPTQGLAAKLVPLLAVP